MKKYAKKWIFFWLAVVTVVFGSWLISWVFTYAPVFKEIGAALGISGLKPCQWNLAFIVYMALNYTYKLFMAFIKAMYD